MHQITPDVGLIPALRKEIAGGFTVHLFTNDIEPNRDTELADLAECGVGSGYGPVAVDAADFVFEGVVDHHATLMHPAVTFSCADTLAVYGYYVKDDNGDLRYVARFDGAPLPYSPGNDISVWPMVGTESKYED